MISPSSTLHMPPICLPVDVLNASNDDMSTDPSEDSERRGPANG